jgi:hypothetical protein
MKAVAAGDVVIPGLTKEEALEFLRKGLDPRDYAHDKDDDKWRKAKPPVPLTGGR